MLLADSSTCSLLRKHAPQRTWCLAYWLTYCHGCRLCSLFLPVPCCADWRHYRLLTSFCRPRLQVGSLMYMAPEVYNGFIYNEKVAVGVDFFVRQGRGHAWVL